MYNTFSILIHVYFSTYLYLHLHIVSILYAYIMDLNNVSHIQLKKYIYFPYIIPSSIKSINTPFFFPTNSIFAHRMSFRDPTLPLHFLSFSFFLAPSLIDARHLLPFPAPSLSRPFCRCFLLSRALSPALIWVSSLHQREIQLILNQHFLLPVLDLTWIPSFALMRVLSSHQWGI